MMLAALTFLALGLAPGGAPAAAIAPQATKEVEGLTVSPVTAAPRLTATYPAEGQAVAPGALVLKLTFDQKMDKARYDVAAAAGGEAPHCLKEPLLLADGKTFTLLCSAKPGQTYAVALNGGDAEAGHRGFANVSDTRAAPATLRFTTTTAEPVRTLEAAMKAAGVDDGTDAPVAAAP